MNRAQAGALAQLSAIARQAAARGDWAQAGHCAREILEREAQNPEGWFLSGLVQRAAGRLPAAVEAFERTLGQDPSRYDAAMELASVYRDLLRHGEARALLEQYQPQLSNSPMYLYKAAETWSRLGLHAHALPLYREACRVQPGVARLQAGLAACAVLNGEIGEAKALYRELLERQPAHQRNHFELSRLQRTTDTTHIDEMLGVLNAADSAPEKNIFLFYALAKELEDLGRWDEAYDYYRKGGDAAAQVARAAGYSVAEDVAVMDAIIATCTGQWLEAAGHAPQPAGQSPIFVVGLPRTGTTLVERIIGSHSQVESADETFFLEQALKRVSGAGVSQPMSPALVEAAAQAAPGQIASSYLDLIGYRLSGLPRFIDKYPFNFLYLGFIARAFPQAPLVHLRRHPMDACFAMFKQSFFRFAYTLDDLAEYYQAYDRLSRHWSGLLGDRLIEVEYEALVADPKAQIRRLLAHLGLEFEPACLDFHLSESPSATASSVQVRERMHTRSIGRWRQFQSQLEPLRNRLERAGIPIE